MADIHQLRADRDGIPRLVAKAKNFAELYGMGPRGLQKLRREMLRRHTWRERFGAKIRQVFYLLRICP